MNSHMLPQEANNYLGKLERLLADLPTDARTSALDDVTAHIEESLESGRSVAETVEGLGPVESFAAQYRDELRVPALLPEILPATLRQTGLLHLVAVGVALLACVFAAFLSPADTVVTSLERSSGSSDGSSYGSSTIQLTTVPFGEVYGVGGLLLLLVPALLALLPLMLPPAWRAPVAIANAAVITGLAALGGFTIGMFFVPLAVMMWAAVLVPWRMAKGLQLANAPLWRIFGSVLVALPALLLVSGGLSGAVASDPPLWVAVVVVVVVALAVAFALGVRASALVVAILGLAGMVLAMAEGGMLAFSFWWFGGLYLACGISAFVAWGTREGAA